MKIKQKQNNYLELHIDLLVNENDEKENENAHMSNIFFNLYGFRKVIQTTNLFLFRTSQRGNVFGIRFVPESNQLVRFIHQHFI